MNAKAEQVKNGCIVTKNGLHTHVKCMGIARSVEKLVNSESKPNEDYIKYIHDRFGINTTIEYLESRILRLVSKSRYKKWKEWKPRKQKYVNRQGRRVV